MRLHLRKRFLNRARARRRLFLLRLQGLRFAQGQIARRDNRRWLRLPCLFGACGSGRGLELVEIRFRHGLGFGHIGLFAIQFWDVEIAAGIGIGRSGIIVGIILCVFGRLGRGLLDGHEFERLFRRLGWRQFWRGPQPCQLWNPPPHLKFLGRLVAAPDQQMQQERQQQQQRQPPGIPAAQLQRIKSVGGFSHVA